MNCKGSRVYYFFTPWTFVLVVDVYNVDIIPTFGEHN